MPARTPTGIAILVATLALAAPASADAPGQGYDAPPRVARQPYRPRTAYRDAYEFGRAPRGVGYGPTVRAYLPRNDTVPIYNEPPAR